MTRALERPVFVVFEGLDGSGKSTVARKVAEALSAEFLTTPSRSVRRYRDEIISGFGGSQEACQLFYLSTVFGAAHEVRALLDCGRSVVLDRYFLSTQAYAAFRGSVLRLDGLGDLLVPADLTVLMDAPVYVRVDRLAQRGESAADRETLAPAADSRLRAEHAARLTLPVLGRVLHLDCGVMGPDALVERVIGALTQSDARGYA
jgi:dTMP kinase